MSMKTIKILETERCNLQVILLELDESIVNTKNQLQASFTGKADTDELSKILSEQQVKHAGLIGAIDYNAKCVSTELERINDSNKSAELDQRKAYVLKSLESLDRASKLQQDLMLELQDVKSYNDKALFRNNSAIQQSIRGLVGKLALEFGLHGSLQMSATIPIPSIDDYDNLVTHINQF